MRVPGPHVAAFLLVLAPAALAGGVGIDRDGDGLYSLEELREEYPTLSEADFAAIDFNQDGWVSPEEFRRGLDRRMLPTQSSWLGVFPPGQTAGLGEASPGPRPAGRGREENAALGIMSGEGRGQAALEKP